MDIGGLFIELLQVALGTRDHLSRVPNVHEWEVLLVKAEEQTVAGILFIGVERLQRCTLNGEGCTANLSLDLKLEWIGEAQMIEATYTEHRRVIAKTRDCLEGGGVKVAFMKGLVCASRYPLPERRECGDIDFVVKEEDLERTLDLLDGIGEVDRELVHEHHGMAFVDDVTLEPHYKVHNFQNPKVDRAMKELFAEVFPENLVTIDLCGEKVPAFPAAFEGIMLTGHMVNHVYAEGLGLRQVVDFYYWLMENGERLKDWGEVWHGLRMMRMERAFRVFARICEEYLGLSCAILNLEYTEKEKMFAKKLLGDILRVGNFGRAEREFGDRQWLVPIRSYLWVLKRCWTLGWLCPAEARWWPVSKFGRFWWKKHLEAHASLK